MYKLSIKKYFWITTIILTLVACTDDDQVVVNPEATTTLSLSSSDALVLTKDMEGTEALSLNWTEPDLGFSAAPTYQLIFNLASGDSNNAARIDVGNVMETSILVEELNQYVTEVGGLTGLANEIIVKVQALLGETVVAESALQPLTVTNYATQLHLQSTWGIVGSGTPNGWDGPDLILYTTNEGNVLVAYVTLADGEIKFRENNEWGGDYGDANGDNVLDQDSDNNIAVTAGTYKVTINFNDLSYSIEPFYWGIVGSATPNGWDGPDIKLVYDYTTGTFRAAAQLVAGELKLRMNDDWGVNYGDANDDGILDQDQDNNIAVNAGYYLVSVDFNTLDYTIEPYRIWGVVGSATPNGWDGPDTKFSPDFTNPGVWILSDMVLTDGEIKFRPNDEWVDDYGDVDNDGILDRENENNISVTAGTYTITLDFSNENKPVYSIN